MTKIVTISDTHNKHDQISLPKGDLLIHAGDFTVRGTENEVAVFGNWLQGLDFEEIVVIPGNHDFLAERNFPLVKRLLGRAHLLHDSSIELFGLKIYGSAWTPFFYNYAFNLRRGSPIKEKWDLIPDDTDILITHGPPQFTMDLVGRGGLATENIGCEELKIAIERIKPKLHVFGHCHSGYGTRVKDGITYINAASLNELYLASNKPIIFNI